MACSQVPFEVSNNELKSHKRQVAPYSGPACQAVLERGCSASAVRVLRFLRNRF